MRAGRELKIGDRAYGRTILALSQYTVPASVLHDYYAERFPNGMPAWIATLTSPHTKSGKIGMTIFMDDTVPE